RVGSHALGHFRLHLDAYIAAVAVLAGRTYPYVLAAAHAAVRSGFWIDLDEVVLLQLGKPGIGARLVAAAFVLHQAAAREDQGELLVGLVRHRLVLHRLEERRQAPEHLDVVVRRVLGDELRLRAVERLAVLRNLVGPVPNHGARLRVAERR